MEKIVKIGEREETFRSSAATPIRYRKIFKKDMIFEMQNMAEAMSKGTGDIDTTTMLEVAYAMSAVGTHKLSFEDWLEQFDLFEMIEALNEILDMWFETGTQVETDLSPKNLGATDTGN